MLWKPIDHRTHTQLLSWLLRPLLESRNMRTIIGANLAASIIFVHSLPPIGGQLPAKPVEVAVLTQEQVQVLTEQTFRFPVDITKGYSQGFRPYHPGVDIRSPLGTDIHPITNGVVSQVEWGHVGYGHKVMVSHDGGLETLYAHMDKIYVHEGDTVTKDTVLGTIGVTGWTTGPHLHLEVHTPNGVINPKQILPELS